MSTPETVLSVNDLRVRFRTLDGIVDAVKGINLTSVPAKPSPLSANPALARARP